MGVRIDSRAFQLLGEIVKPPRPKPRAERVKAWEPEFVPKGRELFYADELNLLAWGEKGSSKSFSGCQKLVRHLYDNQHALAVIGVKEWGMAAKGGAWDKLVNEVLPAFRKGMDLQYSAVWFDKQHHECIWVQNRYDSWCLVVLLSIPYGNMIRDRMPGYEPSFVLWDELTKCDSREYLTAVQAQLGRRPIVQGPQQYLGCCNPDDPDHWVHKAFFDEPFDEKTGVWDKDYRIIHFPVLDNKFLKAGYVDRLEKAYRHDPTELARMVKGEWAARPSGDALFGELYNPILHCRPLTQEGHPDPTESLMPSGSDPIIIGMDPGQVYNAFIFEQWLNMSDKRKWMIFDELVTIRRKIDYEVMVPKVMERLRWWLDELKHDPGQVWISDSSAFNQYRAAAGSYDVLDIERIYEKHRARFGLKPMKIKPAPKFNGSRIARVQLVQRLLANQEIIVSSRCTYLQKMFLRLEGDRPTDGKMIDPDKMLTPKRSDYLHGFDAMSYPMLKASLEPTALIPSRTETFMLSPR